MGVATDRSRPRLANRCSYIAWQQNTNSPQSDLTTWLIPKPNSAFDPPTHLTNQKPITDLTTKSFGLA
jgi:hypothetical protein